MVKPYFGVKISNWLGKTYLVLLRWCDNEYDPFSKNEKCSTKIVLQEPQ